jgi:hypothetical protein
LYRWGNPQTYRTGTVNDQKLFSQHNARWIEPGCPGEDNILVFNNGQSRPGASYSSVDELTPPVDKNGTYYLEPGFAYGPNNLIWSYTAENPTDFYAHFLSSAQRLKNGNTIICDGPSGRFFEVTPEKVTIWEYTNYYPTPYQNDVFNIQYIYPEQFPDNPDLHCEGALNWANIKTGKTIEGRLKIQNIGGFNSSLNWKIESYPNWGIWSFNPASGENLTIEDEPTVVKVTVIVPNTTDTKFDGNIKIINQNDTEDFEIIPVYLTTLRERIMKITLLDFLKNFLNKLTNQ